MNPKISCVVALVIFGHGAIGRITCNVDAEDDEFCDFAGIENQWSEDHALQKSRDSQTKIKNELLGPKQRSVLTEYADGNFFYIIGHAAGDPENACENTMKATRKGLEDGMNAVEVDLSMSVDEVVFLWHDPNPLDPWTRARRDHFISNGLCQPEFRTKTQARYMPFKDIRKNFYYKTEIEGKEVSGADGKIPTFEEWLEEFGNDDRLKLFWFDVKVYENERIPTFMRRIAPLLKKFKIEDRTLFNVEDQKSLDLYQKAMTNEGFDARLIVADHYSSSFILGPDVRRYSSVSFSIAKNTCCATQARPYPPSFSQEAFEKIVKYDINLRDAYLEFTGVRIKILSWTINDESTMEFLINAGIDGIVTNFPKRLEKIATKLGVNSNETMLNSSLVAERTT